MISEHKTVMKFLLIDEIIHTNLSNTLFRIIFYSFFLGYFIALFGVQLIVSYYKTSWIPVIWLCVDLYAIKLLLKRVGFNCDMYILRRDFERDLSKIGEVNEN